MSLTYLLCFISTITWSLVSGQFMAPNLQNRGQTPATGLLSDLEGLVLGIDETIHRLTNPESYRSIDQRNIEQRNEIGGLNPFERVRVENNQPMNYFDRVRQNYDQLSKRILQSLENPNEVFKVPELVNLNFQNKGQKSALDLTAPFLNLQVRGKSAVPKVDANEVKSDRIIPQLPKLDLPDLSGRIKIGGSNEKPINVEINSMQRSSRHGKPRKPLHNSDKKDHLDKPKDGHVKTPYQRRTDTETLLPIVNDIAGNEDQSRILGDLLFSESSFDKYIRLNLERYGTLLFDSNVLPTNVIETIRGVTRNPFTSSLTRRNNGLQHSPVESGTSTMTKRNNGLHHMPVESEKNTLTKRNNGLQHNSVNSEASTLTKRNNGLQHNPVDSEESTLTRRNNGLQHNPVNSEESTLLKRNNGLQYNPVDSEASTLTKRNNGLHHIPVESGTSTLTKRGNGLQHYPVESQTSTLTKRNNGLQHNPVDSETSTLFKRNNGLQHNPVDSEASTLTKRNNGLQHDQVDSEASTLTKRNNGLHHIRVESGTSTLTKRGNGLQHYPVESETSTLTKRNNGLQHNPVDSETSTLTKRNGLQNIPVESEPVIILKRNNGLHHNPMEFETNILTKRNNGLQHNQVEFEAGTLIKRNNGLQHEPLESETMSNLIRRNNGLQHKPVKAENSGFLEKRSGNLNFDQPPVSEYSHNPTERIILAFTEGGVPMKLKLNHNVDDSLGRLSQILSMAGISLNIPVDSSNGNNPVGNNIVQLGSDISGAQSKVLYLDTTDEKQLKTFLKAMQRE